MNSEFSELLLPYSMYRSFLLFCEQNAHARENLLVLNEKKGSCGHHPLSKRESRVNEFSEFQCILLSQSRVCVCACVEGEGVGGGWCRARAELLQVFRKRWFSGRRTCVPLIQTRKNLSTADAPKCIPLTTSLEAKSKRLHQIWGAYRTLLHSKE